MKQTIEHNSLPRAQPLLQIVTKGDILCQGPPLCYPFTLPAINLPLIAGEAYYGEDEWYIIYL